MNKTFEYNWKWDLASKGEDLWKLVSNTNLFNYKSNLAAVHVKKSSTELNTPEKILTIKKFGFSFDYFEEPFEWVYPKKFGVVRKFLNGPIDTFHMLLQLKDRDNGGTELNYKIVVKPKNLFGLLTIPIQIGILSFKAFDKVFRKFDEDIRLNVKVDLQKESLLNDLQRRRVLSILPELKSVSQSPSIVDKLIELIEFGDEYTVKDMRPYTFADIWGEDRIETLRTFLYATRYSLLDLQWDLLCPLCRGAHQSPKKINDINSHLHCESCNIDYRINFDKLVEVTFIPNETIRKINLVEYCVGGPLVTPHIIAQKNIEVGREETVSLVLEKGRYRIRTWKFPSGQLLNASETGNTKIHLSIDENGWKNEEFTISLSPTLTLENKTNEVQQFIIERMEWSDQSTTASEVIALQTFRDLFSEEVLKPGEQISVGSLCILFTDLKSSTQLYRQIGDATAFGLVLDHFKLLKEIVEKNEGALIKTIGDAVMVVFKSPLNSIKFIMQSRQALCEQSGDLKKLKLKAGANYGTCIAVNLNEKLDYFGSTVNFAARLESFSSGEDMIISEKIFTDPEVNLYLNEKKNSIIVEPFDTVLKGFEKETFKLYKLIFENEKN